MGSLYKLQRGSFFAAAQIQRNPFEPKPVDCPHRLTIELEVRFETNDGAFNERVTGKVIRKINPEDLDLWKDQQVLVVPLDLDELDGSFELEFPEDFSKKKRNSAKLVLFFHQRGPGSLNVEWHAKSKSDTGPKTIVEERREIYILSDY